MTNDKLKVLNEEIARQLGLKCIDCGSRKVVYAISKPLPTFPEGAYCYKCLRTRCIKSRMIPFPIPEDLLNNLKRALGLPITAAPIIIKQG